MSSVIVSRLESIRDILRGTDPQITPTVYSSGSHTPAIDRTLTSSEFPCATDGSLTTLSVKIVSGSPDRNLFVTVTLIDNHDHPRGILMRGYCDAENEIHGSGSLPVKQNWKFLIQTRCSMASAPIIRLVGTILSLQSSNSAWQGTDEDNLSGKGSIKCVESTDPSGSSNWTFTIPTFARARPISVKVGVDTGGSTTSPSVQLTDESGNIVNISDRLTLSASSAYNIMIGFGNGFQSHLGTVGNASFISFTDYIMLAGSKIQTGNISSGDDYDGGRIQYEEWLSD